MNDHITLTRDDVEALRRASNVVFFADSEGRAKIRAYLERWNPHKRLTATEERIFPVVEEFREDRERKREFRINGVCRGGTGLMGYASPLDGKRTIGSYLLMGARSSAKWQTIASLAREGQAMEVLFLADYSTHENLRKVNYHADDLVLRLWGLDDRGRRVKVYEFLITTSVGPHDSARMIRAEHDVAQLTTRFSIDDFFAEEAV